MKFIASKAVIQHEPKQQQTVFSHLRLYFQQSRLFPDVTPRKTFVRFVVFEQTRWQRD